MNRQEFLAQLRKGLSGLPQQDTEERLTFYSEMIEDRMEEGLSEEDAVCEIGSVDTIISQIVADIPITKLIKEKATPKKQLKPWIIIALVLGSPIWFSLVVAVFAVILSLYALLCSVVISLWAVFGSLVACALGCTAAGIVLTCNGNALTGIAMIGTGIVCAGLSIFMFYGCKAATDGTLMLAKKMAIWIKNCLIKKEMA